MVNRLWFMMILLFGNSASSLADIICFSPRSQMAVAISRQLCW